MGSPLNRRRIVNAITRRLSRPFVQTLCKLEYQAQEFRRHNERPIELAFVFRHMAQLCPITVLDVGTGTTALPHLMANCGCTVTAIDNIYDYWPKGMFNRHFHIIHDDITNTNLRSEFDFITCVSVLEHIREYDAAVKSLFKLLRPGGHLIITCPYNEHRYIENVYKMEGAGYGWNNPYICQMYSRMQVNRWLQENKGRLVDQEWWQVFSGELWTFGEKLNPPRQVKPDERHQLTCMLFQKPLS